MKRFYIEFEALGGYSVEAASEQEALLKVRQMVIERVDAAITDEDYSIKEM